jgi:hypothetical protein
MSGMFIGGAFGSLGATRFFDEYGWTGVCIYGAILGAIGLLVQLPTRGSK